VGLRDLLYCVLYLYLDETEATSCLYPSLAKFLAQYPLATTQSRQTLLLANLFFPLRNQALPVVVRCTVLIEELDGKLKS
jgi:hypothetical protein